MRETIRHGAQGDDVASAQTLLSSQGYDPGPIDGIFGGRTHGAVTAFQEAWHLAVDGIVGPKTWSALDTATGGGQTLGAWPGGDPNTSWFPKVELNGPIAVHTRHGSNQATAKWSAHHTHQRELYISDHYEVKGLGELNWADSGRTEVQSVPSLGSYSNSCSWSGLADGTYQLVITAGASTSEPTLQDIDVVEFTIDTTMSPSFFIFDGPVILQVNDGWTGFEVHWNARTNGDARVAAQRHVDAVWIDRDGTYVYTGEVRMPPHEVEGGLSYHGHVDAPAEVVPGRYRAVVILASGEGEQGEAALEIPDEPITTEEPVKGPPWLEFSWGPAWSGGAVCWGAVNSGESPVVAGSVADAVFVESDTGFRHQDFVPVANTVQPNSQYQGALVLGELPPGRYYAQVTLALSGQSHGLAWDIEY